MKNRRKSVQKQIRNDEIVRYLAERYHTTPLNVLQRFLEQNDPAKDTDCATFRLEENEMAILRDMTLDNHS